MSSIKPPNSLEAPMTCNPYESQDEEIIQAELSKPRVSLGRRLAWVFVIILIITTFLEMGALVAMTLND